MLVSCWSAKGGVGTTVVAVGLALVLARRHGERVLLVDLAGDVPGVLGLPGPSGPGVADWLAAGPEVPADGLARLEVEAGDGLSVLPRGLGPLAPLDRVEVLAGLLATEPRAVVVDAGLVGGEGTAGGRGACATGCGEAGRTLALAADRSVLVLRACYLGLQRAAAAPLRPSEVVLVTEPGRALSAVEVEAVLDVPVRTELPFEPAVARAVDAGLLACRLPRALDRALRVAP